MVASASTAGEAPEQTEAGLSNPQGPHDTRGNLDCLPCRPVPFRYFCQDRTNPSADATRRFIKGLSLQETFGFDDLASTAEVRDVVHRGRTGADRGGAARQTKSSTDAVLPSRLTGRARPLSRFRTSSTSMTSTLFGALLTNGTLMRIMRDNASLTRPAYIEADLAQIFTNEDAASFAILWSADPQNPLWCCGCSGVTDCALERWRDAGFKRRRSSPATAWPSRSRLALKVLGSGFLEANPDLATRLTSGEVNLTDWFNETPAPRLSPDLSDGGRRSKSPPSQRPPGPIPVSSMRKVTASRPCAGPMRTAPVSWDKHHDRYEGIKIVFRALADGQDGARRFQPLAAFSADRQAAPSWKPPSLRNRAFMEALYRLSWLSDQKTGMVPVNWRAMETEELGSVYESLLELQPQLGDDGKTLVFASEAAEQKGNQRKTTGSYYHARQSRSGAARHSTRPRARQDRGRGRRSRQSAAESSVGHRPGLRLGALPAGRCPPYRHARWPASVPMERPRLPTFATPCAMSREVLPAWGGSQSDGGGVDQGCALDRDGRPRPAPWLFGCADPLRRCTAGCVRFKGASRPAYPMPPTSH